MRKYTATEEAFLLGYADYCIHHGLNYSATVAEEFHKVHPRTGTWNVFGNKLNRLLTSYGIIKPSMDEFRRRGTAYINLANMPLEVRRELDAVRHQWGLGAETTASAQSVIVEAESEPASNDDAASISSR